MDRRNFIKRSGIAAAGISSAAFISPDSFSQTKSSFVTDPPMMGSLKVRGRKFLFDDGRIFFPRGLSILGVNHNEARDEFQRLWNISPEEFFNKLQAAGINFLRIHTYLYSPGGNIWPVPECNADHAEMVEKSLKWYFEQCEKRGIYVALGITHFGEFKPFDKHPYHKNNGGPCSSLHEVATNPEAIKLYKKRIEFYTRFVKYKSFAMWEPFNELWSDEGTAAMTKDEQTAAWVIEMCNHCKKVDATKKPVGANLLGCDNPNDKFFQMVQSNAAVDWISTHNYCNNFKQLVMHPFVLGTGKPVVGSESFDGADNNEWFRNKTWEGAAFFSSELEWSDGFIMENHPMGIDLRNNFDQVMKYLRILSDVLRQTVEADEWGNPFPYALDNATAASTDGKHVMAFFRNSIWGQITEVGVEKGDYEVSWYDCETGKLKSKKTYNEKTPGSLTFQNCQLFLKIPAPGGQAFMYIRPVKQQQ